MARPRSWIVAVGVRHTKNLVSVHYKQVEMLCFDTVTQVLILRGLAITQKFFAGTSEERGAATAPVGLRVATDIAGIGVTDGSS